jgi:hypothetical protein
MDKSDLIAILGEPDRILAPGERGMVSRAWFCSTCAKLHAFAEPVRSPSPCKYCGGIFFEKRDVDQQSEAH